MSYVTKGSSTIMNKRSYHSLSFQSNTPVKDKERRFQATKTVYKKFTDAPDTTVYSKYFGKKNKENKMDQLYLLIEEKIKDSGYPYEINGFQLYNEICDLIEGKENGTYLFLSKKEDDILFEYQVDVMTDDFNLSYVRITTPTQNYNINFDL